MANIVILINLNEYSYHATISNMIHSFLCKNGHSVCIIDINCEKYDHLCITKIQQLHPDILITLDLAGFHFRTQAGELALNMLLTKNLNLLWGNKSEYAPFLSKKLSLSMLFYDGTGTDNKLTQLYPNMLYYKVLGEIFCVPTSESTTLTNEKSFQQIWSDFIQEILLCEI